MIKIYIVAHDQGAASSNSPHAFMQVVSDATRAHERAWEQRRREDNEQIRLGQYVPLSWRQAVKEWRE